GTDQELTKIGEELVARNSRLLTAEQELALVLLATPGPLGPYLGMKVAAPGPPTLVLHTFPVPYERYASWFREGARLVTPSTQQPAAECIDPRIKHRSRLHWWLAEQEVKGQDPGASALLL